MTRIYFLLIIGFLISRVNADQLEYLHVNLDNGQVGMFSVFNYVVGVLSEYENNPQKFAGLKVDFEDKGLYYDSARGRNWWEYYCEPILFPNKENTKIEQTVGKYVYYAYRTEMLLDRQRVFELIQKYIKVRPRILEKIDLYVKNNFVEEYVISVHYRGTDKIQSMSSEAPFVAYHQVSQSVEQYITEKKLQKYKIFVATDEQPFVEYMKKTFPSSVIAYDATRSTNNTPIHYTSFNARHGEEALIDSLLLSRGNVLIRTSSNLSLWATYFNPSIPVIELSQRNSGLGVIKLLLKQ